MKLKDQILSQNISLYINELKLAVINICRPPGTTSESFEAVLKAVDNWLNRIQKEFKDSRTIIVGDFNMKHMKDWNVILINELKKSTTDRREKDLGISQDKA